MNGIGVKTTFEREVNRLMSYQV